MSFVTAVVFSAVDGSVTQTSSAIDASLLFAGSVQGVTTSAAAGTLKMQASNDATAVAAQVANWTDVTSITVTIGAATTGLIPKFDMAYRWVRFVWTHSGTAGNLSVNFMGLGF